MSTAHSLLLMVAACIIGLPIFKVMVHIMGIGGSVGALVYRSGERNRIYIIRNIGLALTAIGQSFVVGGYSVGVVILVRWYSGMRPDLPTWPLWVAAIFHALGTPVEALERKPQTITVQHRTLVITSMIGVGIFLLAIFKPSLTDWVFGWLPNARLLHRN
jgi:hypothetical protein